MYDYGERDGDSVASAGIGSYCLMGSGNHLDNGRSPSPVCAYLRDLAGWCDNEIDLSAAGDVRGARTATTTRCMKYRTQQAERVLPRREPLEDGARPRRCRRAGSRSTTATSSARTSCSRAPPTKHYQCALLQADGRRDLELNVNQGDGADLFGAIAGRRAVGGVGAALARVGRPRLRAWSSPTSRAPGETITFRVGRGRRRRWSRPARPSPMLAIPDNQPAGVSSTITIDAVGHRRADQGAASTSSTPTSATCASP